MSNQHTFYQGLKIKAAEPIDERFYISSLTTEELQRVFGSDGRYGFAKAFVFNTELNKFQYLNNFVAKTDVINVSNWITHGDPLLIEVSKTELDALISASNLIVGVTYKITGVHPTLYNDGTNSGTTIYLKALTTNTLSKEGHGEFWNPKYDQSVDGFGIWNNRSSYSIVQMQFYASEAFVDTGSQPTNMAMDSAKNIYVCNYADNTVSKITPEGVVTLYGTTGAGPVAITVSNTGLVFTANKNANTITKIDTFGTSTTWGPTGAEPVAIFVENTSGNVFTANKTAGTITKVTPAGLVTTTFATVGAGPVAITNGNNGLYTANSIDGTISQVTYGGIVTLNWATVPNISNLAYSFDGNLYGSANSTGIISKISNTGVVTSVATIVGNPVAIRVANNMQIYTVNGSSGLNPNVVTRISPRGSIHTFSTSCVNSSNLVMDVFSANIYVSDKDSNKIRKLVGSYIDFVNNENITANNGATGKLFAGADSGKFIILTGNWSAALSFSGNSSGAIANISSVTPKTFAIGDKTIWGGYSWTNVNGNIGDKTNILSLNSEWTKDTYSSNNYNKSVDIIEYDYTNNWISKRREIEHDNEVVYTYRDHQYWGLHHAISVFMFGNGWNGTRGVFGNKVHNSYFECVDFGARRISKNIVNDSLIFNNTFVGSFHLRNNILSDDGEIYGNVVVDGFMRGNTVKNDSYITNNTLTNQCNLSYNTFSQGRIDLISANANSQIHNNHFIGSRLQRMTSSGRIYFMNNMLQESFVQDSKFDGNTTFESCHMVKTVFAPGTSVILSDKSIYGVIFANVSISQDISESTIIYGNYDKTVYKRPNGTPKIRYYDNDDALVIADITD